MILLLIPFLYLAFSNPLGEPARTILEVIYLCIVLEITFSETSRNADEVEVADAGFSASAGAYAGIVCTVGLLIVMSNVPAMAEFIAALAEPPAKDLPPAATGFGLGTMAAILLMLVCARIGVSRNSVNAIENGGHDPSLPLAFRIAKQFGLPIDHAFEDES